MENTKPTLNIDARTFPLEQPKGNLLGFATLTIENCFVVDNIKIIMSKDGNPFVSMPQVKDKENNWRDVCFPITAKFRKEIIKAVLDDYKLSISDD